MKKVLILCLALTGAAGALSVIMLVNSFDNFDGLYQHLCADPRFDVVYRYRIRYDPPPPELLQLHDCATIDGYFRFCDMVTLGNLLADYVDGGGRVVCNYYAMKGPYEDDGSPLGRWWFEGYSPYACLCDADYHYPEDLIIDEPGHPIFDGISAVNGARGRMQTELRAGAVELAHFADAGGVALNADETVCGINYRSSNDHFWTGEGFRLIANAACYLADYVDIQPSSWGRIKALGE
jgi:hypothetical protein